jgi:hypothetical protein
MHITCIQLLSHLQDVFQEESISEHIRCQVTVFLDLTSCRLMYTIVLVKPIASNFRVEITLRPWSYRWHVLPECRCETLPCHISEGSDLEPKLLSGVWLIWRVLDWMIWFIAPYTFTIRNYRQYSAIAILHTLSSPLHTHQGSQSSLVVSWQRIYNSQYSTHEVFFSQLKSFLAISFQSFDCHFQGLSQFSAATANPGIRLNSIRSSYPGRLASRNSNQLDSTRLLQASELFLITTLHEPRGKHRRLLSRIVLGVFTDPLPSNRRPIVMLIGSRGNVFTESLPSSGYTRRSMLLGSNSLILITNDSPYA